MAEAIVSVVLAQLASITRQQIPQEVTLVRGVSKKVERMDSNFQAIQAVLVDAELRQMKETSVKLWIDKLKEVSYDVENVLDEWNTSKLKQHIERAENSLTLKKKVCSFFLSPCFCFKQIVLHHDIGLKLKVVDERLDGIAKEKDRYSFNTITSGEQPRGVETTSFIDEYSIYGRDKEKNELMSKLLCQSSNEQECLHIISIVGMGGIGKTTLVQLAHNNNEVKNHFDKRVWVCVSNPFDVLRVANAILQGLAGQSSTSATLQTVLENIHQSIIGKKLLLVLDDVWTEDYKDWEPLYNCLKNCLNGSRIIVTTRKETVAFTMNSFVIILMKELSENESWSLFKHFAFYGRSHKECSELEGVGKEIVSKCKGLPLATKTIGSLLRCKSSRDEWKIILDSEMWVLEGFEKNVIAPLLLSYNDLPPMVKRCFLYCAVFPKDYQINKNELIRLWMAQDYLNFERNNKEMEKIGEDHFSTLGARSFFQEFIKDNIGDIFKCKMHDIVHDFAQFLTNKESLTIDKDFGELSNNILFEKVHHLMLEVDKNNTFPNSICNIKKLQTLLIKFESNTCSIDGDLLKLLGQNKCLRALALSGTSETDMVINKTRIRVIRLEKIPNEIGKLIHLRYLDLSKNMGLEMLPETLCELYNLQTLNVSWCKNLKELPQGMGKLINLRHLINRGTDSLKYMPKGIEKLTCLRTLREFYVSEHGYGSKACSLECLNKFLNLQGAFDIKGLGNVINVSDAGRIQLANMKNILELGLGFHGSDSMNNEAILEALQPLSNVRELEISDYSSNAVLPNWVESFTNLRRVALNKWIKCEHLPPLGKLSSLESLHIERMKRVKRVGNELLGLESGDYISSLSVTIFPKLKYLWLWEMEEWEEWDFGIEHHNITIMPSLHTLEIKNCPKLKALPKQVLQAPPQVLSINWCPMLRARYEEGAGKHWSDISHIPNIAIDREYVKRGGP